MEETAKSHRPFRPRIVFLLHLYSSWQWQGHTFLGSPLAWWSGTQGPGPQPLLTGQIQKRTVRQEIQNDNWIRNLQNIDNPVMLQEFVLLFMAISNITLTEERDSIHWRWTSNGKYTVKSAYEVQFRGATVYFPAKEIWTARTEPKCRLFAWLALHNKVLTAENMIRKNWPCNPTCSLCYCLEETTVHLLTQCNYTEAAWNMVAARHLLPSYDQLLLDRTPKGWVNYLLATGSSVEKKRKLGVLFSFWWEIWKGRNRSVQ